VRSAAARQAVTAAARELYHGHAVGRTWDIGQLISVLPVGSRQVGPGLGGPSKVRGPLSSGS